MKRIAAPMIGGMVSSTVLTLVVIPAVYSLWKERQLATQTGAVKESDADGTQGGLSLIPTPSVHNAG
jgi:Cu(I)/Ag(I) efflux system membrane protein CusA/SilA